MCSTPSRPRGSALASLAVGLVVLVVAGIVLWIALTRADPPAAAQSVPAAEPPQPSHRVAIPEVREPVSDPFADAVELWRRARELAAGDGPREAVLRAYAEAEDALRELVDALPAGTRAWGDRAQKIELAYQNCAEESDAIATALFDDERIERTPWRDLIAEPGSVAQNGLQGLARKDGEIRAIGPRAGSRLEGLFSMGDAERWRDFVIEVEYAPIGGSSRIYFRADDQIRDAPDEIYADGVGDEALAPEQLRTLTATYVGSLGRLVWSANTGLEPVEHDIGWRRSRVGAFVVVLSETAEIRITRLRARILRAGP